MLYGAAPPLCPLAVHMRNICRVRALQAYGCLQQAQGSAALHGRRRAAARLAKGRSAAVLLSLMLARQTEGSSTTGALPAAATCTHGSSFCRPGSFHCVPWAEVEAEVGAGEPFEGRATQASHAVNALAANCELNHSIAGWLSMHRAAAPHCKGY
jgi:hypothetical protein